MRSRRFTTYCWGVIAFNLLVILWGAVVRATGSGAGCGSHWPLCNGEVVPLSASSGTLIEYSHRLTSGLALLTVVVMLIWARKIFRAGEPARLGATLAMIFMLGEAAIGAGIVLFELVADNASMARAMFMATHLVNTFLLIAAMVLTAYWSAGGAKITWRGQGRLAWLLLASLLGTLLIGASGAVAALGDTLFAASSLAEALRQDLSSSSHLLVQLRTLHPLIAVLVGLLLLYVASVVRLERGKEARRYARRLSLMVFVQLAIGSLNVALLAPTWMQLVHLLMADVLWIVLVLTAATSLQTQEAPLEVRSTALAQA